MPKGHLITLEGIDGSGKSTACRTLAAALRERGLVVHERVEPTRTWLGEAVRRGFAEKINPWSEALLFMADHAEHVRAVEAQVKAGAIVLSDRWSDSTFAYQGAILSESGLDAVQWLQDTELAFDLKPDLTLLFDIEPEAALARVAARGQSPEKFEKLDLLRRVRANYLRLAKEEPKRFVVLDASRAPEAVLVDATRAVVARTSPR
jgi:dTMP kinase